jgi:hypothetical protein
VARIRTIKPEYWEDERVAALSPLARLLFIGSWNHADDEGIVRWTPDYLNASLFMYDGLTAKRVQRLMDEVAKADLVFPYMAGKSRQQLAYVVNFRKHQRIDKPQPGRFPPPQLENEATALMYARRDRWTCGVCKDPINHELTLLEGNDRNLALALIVPRHKGGTEVPTNVRAVHISCRDSGPRSVTDSRNGSANGSTLEGKGKEQGEERIGDPDTPASSSNTVVAPTAADDDTISGVLSDTWALMAYRRMERRGGEPVRDKAAYVRRAAKAIAEEFTDQAKAAIVLDPSIEPTKLADMLDFTSTEGRPPCERCESTGWVPDDADGFMAPCPKCNNRVAV